MKYFPEIAAAVDDEDFVRLQCLLTSIPTQIAQQVLKSLVNGWVTSSRIRQGDEAPSSCIFKCSAFERDSFDHYVRCPVVWQILSEVAPGLEASDSIRVGLLLWFPTQSNAVTLYAITSTYQTVRAELNGRCNKGIKVCDVQCKKAHWKCIMAACMRKAQIIMNRIVENPMD